MCVFHLVCYWALPIALWWWIPKLCSWWISLKQISSTYSSDGSSIGLQIKTKAAVSPHQRYFSMKSNTLCLSLQRTTDWEPSFLLSSPPLFSLSSQSTRQTTSIFHWCFEMEPRLSVWSYCAQVKHCGAAGCRLVTHGKRCITGQRGYVWGPIWAFIICYLAEHLEDFWVILIKFCCYIWVPLTGFRQCGQLLLL